MTKKEFRELLERNKKLNDKTMQEIRRISKEFDDKIIKILRAL